MCVHTSGNDVPPEFTLLKIEGPDTELPVIHPGDLPPDWQARLETTRNLGTAWLRKNEAILLQAPSALVPETANFLFNPMHPDSRNFQITGVFAFPFDGRLKA